MEDLNDKQKEMVERNKMSALLKREYWDGHANAWNIIGTNLTREEAQQFLESSRELFQREHITEFSRERHRGAIDAYEAFLMILGKEG